MISAELSIVLGKQFDFIVMFDFTLEERYKNNGGLGKTDHCEGTGPPKKVCPSFFYPPRPLKLKKRE